MVRTHKPSSWQAGPWRFDRQTQEEVKKCYPPQVMEEIIKAARLEKITPDLKKQAKLAKIIERNIISLGEWIINCRNLSDRPSPAQRKAALEKIEKAVHTLNVSLKKLDSDSSDDLRRTMLSDSFSNWALGTDPELDAPRPLRGYAKFQTLVDIISKLEQWAAIAQEHTQEPKDGDKHADIKRWFAEGLIEIWILIGYKKPTITWRYDYSKTTGALMEFANAAARPLKLDPMEAALRQEIEQWKKKGPKPPRKTPFFR
ncbi:MAG: hypothetical protein ABSB79_04655 [Syntrophales bacterium]|jgi:hypothetical protein